MQLTEDKIDSTARPTPPALGSGDSTPPATDGRDTLAVDDGLKQPSTAELDVAPTPGMSTSTGQEAELSAVKTGEVDENESAAQELKDDSAGGGPAGTQTPHVLYFSGTPE